MAKKEKKPTNPKFAQAIMKGGVQHFAFGGDVASVFSPVGELAGGIVGGVANPLVNSIVERNPYQAQLAPTQTTNYSNAINTSLANAMAGYGNAQAIQAQQQQLANMLLAQSQGQGPNPAQAMLAQATGQNTANQAALMAGQRGAGANVGLMARQAAMQGANTQQQAVGQGAVMQAQQQLAAQQALAQQQALMGQQNLQQQSVMAGLYGSAAGAQNAQNTGAIQNYNMMQGINSGVAGSNADVHNKVVGGLIGGGSAVGAAAATPPPAAAAAAKGGMVGDGTVTPPRGKNPHIPEHLYRVAEIFHPHLCNGGQIAMQSGGQVPGQAQVAGDSLKNDKVPAVLSPGEVVLPRSVTQSADAPAKAAEFMKLLMERKEKGESGYSKVASAKRKGKK